MEGRGYGPDAQAIPETALEGLGVARRQNAAEPAVNADPHCSQWPLDAPEAASWPGKGGRSRRQKRWCPRPEEIIDRLCGKAAQPRDG